MTKRPAPTQRSLFETEETIDLHRRELDDLRSRTELLPTTANLWDINVNKGMETYHEMAMHTLERGVPISETIDGLTEDELIYHMRSQGYFVCIRSSKRKKKRQ